MIGGWRKSVVGGHRCIGSLTCVGRRGNRLKSSWIKCHVVRIIGDRDRYDLSGRLSEGLRLSLNWRITVLEV
jgi:hypothetical protein